MLKHCRKPNGHLSYEVSSIGDKRFSALYAKLQGRTIESIYQCDVKGYNPGGNNWRDYKGKPPLNNIESYNIYKSLWKRYLLANPDLIYDLYLRACEHDGYLSDVFGYTEVTQARALIELLNEFIGEMNHARKETDLD